jgi:hypothetical protein
VLAGLRESLQAPRIDYSTQVLAALIPRRIFLQQLAGGLMITHAPLLAQQSASTLHNGITLGRPWPPQWRFPSEHPTLPPYLTHPPRVIPIDVGRQLFVDDFLIEETTLVRQLHAPTYHSANPVVRPDRPWEQRDDVADRLGAPPNPAAMVFSDGVFYDPRDRLFKMWYMGGYAMATCLATSDDGVRWRKPTFDVVPGTNIVHSLARDSSTVWLDHDAVDATMRFKMTVWSDKQLVLLSSADGIHWRTLGRTGTVGDRSTFFYNPFRDVWVFSIRADENRAGTGRYRRYWETRDFLAARDWQSTSAVAWIKADSADFAAPGLSTAPELYNLDCVAYESVLLGLFAIWRGEPGDREKINEVTVGFSRDGFHWSRPERRAFLPVANAPGEWNWANVQSAGGCCVVVGDQLYFYVSGRQGRPGSNAPGVCATGLATLRRDGFASMDWIPDSMPAFRRSGAPDGSGVLTTRPVTFSGGYLFVNADVTGGDLRVEVLDADGRAVEPLTRDRCERVSGESTRHPVEWTAGSLRSVAGRPVRFRFTLTRGRLYSFWVSKWPTGESNGYIAAGGSGFHSAADRPPA